MWLLHFSLQELSLSCLVQNWVYIPWSSFLLWTTRLLKDARPAACDNSPCIKQSVQDEVLCCERR